MIQGFLAVRKHADRILLLAEMMQGDLGVGLGVVRAKIGRGDACRLAWLGGGACVLQQSLLYLVQCQGGLQ